MNYDNNDYTTKKSYIINIKNPDWKVTEKKRILLVGVNIPAYYNLAIRILSLMLNRDSEFRKTCECRFIEFSCEDDLKNISTKIMDYNPDFIGISVNIWNRNKIFGIAGAVKTNKPEITIIAGGQEVTNSVTDYLDAIPALDFIIDGEGEFPLLEFFQNWNWLKRELSDPENVSGLHYRKDGGTKYTRPANLINDLDNLPSSILEGALDLKTNWRLGIMLEGTRGCPLKCSYCFEGDKKVTVRTSSIERISKEVWHAADQGATYFHLLDPILCNSNLSRLQALSNLFRDVKHKYPGIAVSVEAYAHQITDEIAVCMKNFTFIDIGLQTTNPKTAYEIHRTWDLKKFKKGIHNLRKHSASCCVYLIMGLPYESVTSYIRGIKIVLDENPLKIFCNELLLLNGTELRRRASEYEYKYDSEPPYGISSNNTISFKEFKVIQLLSKMIEKQHNFSLRSLFPSAKWLPDKLACSYKSVSIYPEKYSISEFQEFIRGKNIENDLVEIVYSQVPSMKELLNVVGQLQLGGCGWIKLTVPYEFVTEERKNLLVKRGVCQYRLTVPNIPKEYEDIKKNVSHFNKEVKLSYSAFIVPYTELVFNNWKAMTISDFWQQIKLGTKCSVTAMSIFGSENLKLDENDEMRLTDAFYCAINNKVWLKLPENMMRIVLKDNNKYTEIIDNLNSLGSLYYSDKKYEKELI